MGGTSCDVALIAGGAPTTQAGWRIEHKIPVQFPAIDVATIGAGGGTIAWIDRARSLRSGPQSAGARPGPAAYAMGGEDPTNTDANLVLGRLDPDNFLGGEFKLSAGLARAAIESKIAEPLGMSVEDAAEGILRVSNDNMVEALRLISVERGNDPRDYALIAFGGAGPVHAAHCAAELSIPTVLVPRSPASRSGTTLSAPCSPSTTLCAPTCSSASSRSSSSRRVSSWCVKGSGATGSSFTARST
jgi:N-methylhydantoinase A